MAAINAAWELIGDPAAARGLRPSAGRRARPDGRASREAAPTPGSTRDRGAARLGAAAAPRPSQAADSDGRPRSSRATGRPAVRPRAAATTTRCARPTASAPPARRPVARRERVLNFGRYAGWSLGEVARHDLEYIEWLDRAPIGRNYRRGDRRHPALDRPARAAAAARPPTGGGSSADARRSADRSAPGRRRRPWRIVGRDRDRSTTQPTVVPWTSRVNSTTPKVISWRSSRCGMSAGSDRAMATATAPRRPPQKRTCSQCAGMRSARPGSGASREAPPRRT